MTDREYLRRTEAAAYLRTRYGIPKSSKTLAKDAVLGNDAPPFYKAGRFPLYAVSDLDAWAKARIGARSFRNTTEFGQSTAENVADVG